MRRVRRILSSEICESRGSGGCCILSCCGGACGAPDGERPTFPVKFAVPRARLTLLLTHIIHRPGHIVDFHQLIHLCFQLSTPKPVPPVTSLRDSPSAAMWIIDWCTLLCPITRFPQPNSTPCTQAIRASAHPPRCCELGILESASSSNDPLLTLSATIVWDVLANLGLLNKHAVRYLCTPLSLSRIYARINMSMAVGIDGENTGLMVSDVQKLLFLGLDNAGKTTLLHMLKVRTSSAIAGWELGND